VRSRRRRLAAGLLAAVIGAAAACGTPQTAGTPAAVASETPSPSASPVPTPAPASAPVADPPAPAPAPALPLAVTGSEYGMLSITTAPGASCTASAILSSGAPVPGLGGARRADGGGRITWVYLAVPTRAARGVYTIQCSAGSLRATATAPFTPGS
jgi:hypothetical protein